MKTQGTERVRPMIEFDQTYYAAHNPDLSEAPDLREHFELAGWREDRDPALAFDSYYYKTVHLGTETGKEDALSHYNATGRLKNARPIPPNCEVLTKETAQVSDASYAVHCFIDDLSLWPELCDVLLDAGVNQPLFLAVRDETEFEAALRYVEQYPGLADRCRKVMVGRGAHPLASLLDVARQNPEIEIWGHAYNGSSFSDFDQPTRGYLLGQHFGSKARISHNLSSVSAGTGTGLYFSQLPRFSRARFYKDFQAVWPERRRGYDYPQECFFWVRAEVLHRAANTPLPVPAKPSEAKRTFGLLRRIVEATVDAGLTFRSFRSEPVTSLLLKHPATSAQDIFDRQGSRWRSFSASITSNRPLPLNTAPEAINGKRIDLHWVIPDFSEGGGGHMTIFRFVNLLERPLFRQTIWIQNCHNHRNPAQAKQKIRQWYQPIADDVIVRFLPDDVEAIKGDAVIATDCWTAFPVSRMAGFKERFYFIQDWETEFFPAGDNRLAAGLTYDLGFTALTAGSWLAQKAKAAGMDVVEWALGADRANYGIGTGGGRAPKEFSRNAVATAAERYRAQKIVATSSKKPADQGAEFKYWKNGLPFHPDADAGDIPHVALYARGHTPRRAVELAMAGFIELANRGWLFHLHFFGEEKDFGELPFVYTPHGLCDAPTLSRLYEQCDVGVAFSATNYSLVPLEMMLSGLCVLEIDTDSTRAAYPEGIVTRAQPAAYAIADEMARLFERPDLRRTVAEAGLKFAEQLDWQKSIDTVGNAISSRVIAKARVDVSGLLEEVRQRSALPVLAAPSVSQRPAASVFIPTYNAGQDFDVVLQALAEQKFAETFELVIIDSGSTDVTLELIERWSKKMKIGLTSITTDEFGHGRTRNQGIGMAEGEYVAILTQDACPASPDWLQNLVGGFAAGDRVAGVFGRHTAYPMHELFEAEGLDAFFESWRLLGSVQSMDAMPSYVHPGSPNWQSALQFYSDNNSCLRKSVWKDIPYRDVPWGEDQVWAWEVIRLGFQKAYAHDAAVYHSHDYGPKKLLQVGREEGRMFLKHFGMYIGLDEDLPSRTDDLVGMVRGSIEAERAKLAEKGIVDERLLLRRAIQNLALYKGRAAGTTAEKKAMRGTN